jgi:signal transduction histidine kinase
VEIGLSTRDPPGWEASTGRRPDTLRSVVLAYFTRRGRSAGLFAQLRNEPSLSQIDIPPAVTVVRLLVLAMVLVTVPLSTPGFGTGTRGVATAVSLVVALAAWAVWQFAAKRPRLWLATIATMGLAGGALAGLDPLSPAVAVGCVVTVSAGARLPAEMSLAIVAETVAAFLIAAVASNAPPLAIVGWTAGFLGMWAFGLTRRAYLLRAEDAEAALEHARRAHTAETQAAALAERARIAREIHDVLAHSLAAVSVNLQAAEGLLDAVPDKGAELAKAIECVQRAGALTKEGMAETRQAILALRDDGHDRNEGAGAANADADLRLTARLRALAEEHGAAGDASVEFGVTGTARPIGADRALTVYRTAQEALTNARKHAPGQPVSMAVGYTPNEVTLRVGNPLPPAGTAGPLAHAGTGYGLTGLQERAALAGGTLTTGPDNGAWHVLLRLPAPAEAALGRIPGDSRARVRKESVYDRFRCARGARHRRRRGRPVGRPGGPGPAARHPAGDHRRGAGRRRRGRHRPGGRDQAAGRADGPEHAAVRRGGRHGAHHRGAPRYPGGGAHHLCRR